MFLFICLKCISSPSPVERRCHGVLVIRVPTVAHCTRRRAVAVEDWLGRPGRRRAPAAGTATITENLWRRDEQAVKKFAARIERAVGDERGSNVYRPRSDRLG
ncbi:MULTISPECIES: hypothetical protein [Paraburkholderia]|uniref:hypothetical protein n=1 Tax=Paraburkholderia TaxID=1822464 RepID=UPI001654F0A4|nr:hypothetical protein [Paraburkholderia podalyriae]